jgi:desulfoferrodoxin (superoxide reductase-like protein)
MPIQIFLIHIENSKFLKGLSQLHWIRIIFMKNNVHRKIMLEMSRMSLNFQMTKECSKLLLKAHKKQVLIVKIFCQNNLHVSIFQKNQFLWSNNC